MSDHKLNQTKGCKIYDIIFVGQLGAVVASHFLKTTSYSYKCLVINNQRSIIEPSIFHNQSNEVIIKNRTYQDCDFQQTGIKIIKPLLKQIQMENSTLYYYKYLVYTNNCWIKYDHIGTLQEALENDYSLVYSNYKKNDLSKIYKYNYGNLIFYIPKGRHQGYENYYFLSIYNKFIKENKTIHQTFKCKVILEGTTFFPFSKQTDQFIKKKLSDSAIEVVYNTKILKIDYLRRKLKLKSKQQISYTIFYCIIPQIVPQLLLDSEIDPYNNNPKTLFNKKYKNIVIFGADIFPTTHSFNAINMQAHVIRQNLLNLLLKKSQLTNYEGESTIKFWYNTKQYCLISTNYEKKQKISNQLCGGWFFGLFSTQFYTWQINSFYNLSTYGQPYFIFAPALPEYKISSHEDKNQHRELKSNFNI